MLTMLNKCKPPPPHETIKLLIFREIKCFVCSCNHRQVEEDTSYSTLSPIVHKYRKEGIVI